MSRRKKTNRETYRQTRSDRIACVTCSSLHLLQMTDPRRPPVPPATGTSEATESGTAMFGVDAVNKDRNDSIFFALLALPQPCHGLSASSR